LNLPNREIHTQALPEPTKPEPISCRIYRRLWTCGLIFFLDKIPNAAGDRLGDSDQYRKLGVKPFSIESERVVVPHAHLFREKPLGNPFFSKNLRDNKFSHYAILRALNRLNRLSELTGAWLIFINPVLYLGRV
jgi:hypothetical protein